MRIGLVGCGNISDIYLSNAKHFRDIDFVACADLRREAAARQAERYGIAQRDVETLIASDDVDIVLNLTIPEAHAAISQAAIDAGKHVYTEKPLATGLSDGVALIEAAKSKGLRVGCAPDTVLGGAVQEARRRMDDGEIGRPLLGVASVLSHGMEDWHPNPGFFFRAGGGPVFDMGPYYLTTLVTLLGPVASILAMGQIGFAERIVTAKGPENGKAIKVETLTSLQALLEFHSGAQITFLASWDVWAHGLLPIELHGTGGSLRVPDPNWFGGDVAIAEGRKPWVSHATTNHVFGSETWPTGEKSHINYRGVGLAEMARAITEGRPHRANGDIGLHVLAIMEGILGAAIDGKRVVVEQGCERPAPLGKEEARALIG
jgi:predicted dehydrogenase